jgi:hypothetical protein
MLEHFDINNANNNNTEFLKMYNSNFSTTANRFMELFYTDRYQNNSVKITNRGQVSITFGYDDRKHIPNKNQVLQANGSNLQSVLFMFRTEGNIIIVNQYVEAAAQNCPLAQEVICFGGLLGTGFMSGSRKKYVSKYLTSQETIIKNRRVMFFDGEIYKAGFLVRLRIT